MAFTLDFLGRRDDALSTMEQAAGPSGSVRAVGLFGGLSGIGLNLLHFARVARDGALRERALGIADRLADALRAGTAEPDLPGAVGLMRGMSGPALFFLRCFRHTGDDEFVELAAVALRRDLDRCERGPRNTLQPRRGARRLPQLAVGAAGIGLVLREFLRHRPDETFSRAESAIRNACRADTVSFPGLFNGHAGLMAYLGTDEAADFHLRRLSWYAEPYGGGLAVLGDRLHRLSMDLATGAAGVLLALRTVLDGGSTFLPFLDVPRLDMTRR